VPGQRSGIQSNRPAARSGAWGDQLSADGIDEGGSRPGGGPLLAELNRDVEGEGDALRSNADPRQADRLAATSRRGGELGVQLRLPTRWPPHRLAS